MKINNEFKNYLGYMLGTICVAYIRGADIIYTILCFIGFIIGLVLVTTDKRGKA